MVRIGGTLKSLSYAAADATLPHYPVNSLMIYYHPFSSKSCCYSSVTIRGKKSGNILNLFQDIKIFLLIFLWLVVIL
jgi:hypothetical protein